MTTRAERERLAIRRSPVPVVTACANCESKLPQPVEATAGWWNRLCRDCQDMYADWRTLTIRQQEQ